MTADEALDAIAATLRHRAGDSDIANAITVAHIEDIVADTGRTIA